jgi:hypothetical protein
MGHFTPTLTDRQRNAVLYAVLDASGQQRVSAKQAAELAAGGQMPGPYSDLGPYVISIRHCQQLVQEERRHREGLGKSILSQTTSPTESGRKVLAELFDAIAEDLAVVKRRKRGDRAPALSAIARATRDAIALEQALEPKQPNTNGKPETPGPSKKEQTPAQRLTQRIRANGHHDNADSEDGIQQRAVVSGQVQGAG